MNRHFVEGGSWNSKLYFVRKVVAQKLRRIPFGPGLVPVRGLVVLYDHVDLVIRELLPFLRWRAYQILHPIVGKILACLRGLRRKAELLSRLIKRPIHL